MAHVVRGYTRLGLVRKRFHYTLMEVLIVMTLIGFIGALMGFNGIQLLREQRFRAGVEEMREYFQLVQLVALSYDNNAKVILKEDPQGEGVLLELKLDYSALDNDLNEISEPELIRRMKTPVKITAIKAFAMEENGVFQTNDTKFVFLSKHMIVPKGVLHLYADSSTKGEGTQAAIAFAGYPAPLRSKTQNIQEPRSEKLYPKYVRECYAERMMNRKSGHS